MCLLGIGSEADTLTIAVTGTVNKARTTIEYELIDQKKILSVGFFLSLHREILVPKCSDERMSRSWYFTFWALAAVAVAAR